MKEKKTLSFHEASKKSLLFQLYCPPPEHRNIFFLPHEIQVTPGIQFHKKGETSLTSIPLACFLRLSELSVCTRKLGLPRD